MFLFFFIIKLFLHYLYCFLQKYQVSRFFQKKSLHFKALSLKALVHSGLESLG